MRLPILGGQRTLYLGGWGGFWKRLPHCTVICFFFVFMILSIFLKTVNSCYPFSWEKVILSTRLSATTTKYVPMFPENKFNCDPKSHAYL